MSKRGLTGKRLYPDEWEDLRDSLVRRGFELVGPDDQVPVTKQEVLDMMATIQLLTYPQAAPAFVFPEEDL